MASQSKSDNETVLVAISNLYLSEDLKVYKQHLRVLVHILSRHTLVRAFFHPPPVIPVSLLQDIVSSATKCPTGYVVTLHNDQRVVIDKKVFAAALHLPYYESTFDQPTDGDLKSMIYNMGYLYDLQKLFHMSKGHISPFWQCLIHYIIKCLTGKMGGTDQLNRRLMGLLWSLYSGREVDHAAILFEDFLSYIPSSLKPTALLKLADPTDPAVFFHLTSTKGVPNYPSHSLKQCEVHKKLKKKAFESSLSKQPPKKKQRKVKTKSFTSEFPLSISQRSPTSEFSLSISQKSPTSEFPLSISQKSPPSEFSLSISQKSPTSEFPHSIYQKSLTSAFPFSTFSKISYL
ncbi:hypothetical protein L2E82_49710 [Cichorium intybus]|uniref:Uncharacterized protein n=1 Tax=Cichorium intybus TaxID=13427 RepID=A0ACB8Z1C7_CICIN|nr:hypothetical protein L2E82_49710 [Cichorium intybus]